MHDPLAPLLADGVIDEILTRLKSGKEADLWLVRHRGEVVAAKVYKERKARSFKNDSAYKEGRQVRNSRTQRAMDKGSRFGQAAAEEAWKSKEADALHALHAAGVRVPRPVIFYEGVLLMELVLDPEGHPAPRLIDAHVTEEHARPLYEDLRQQAVRMLCNDLIHGDLSPYNILAGQHGPVVIDFPQVVGAAHNSQAERFFQRDLDNLRRFFEPFDHSLRAHASDAREIWRAYQRRELTPEFVPSGRVHQEGPRRDRPRDDRPREGRPPGDRPRDDRPREGRPASDRPPGDRSRDGRPPGDRPRNDRPRDGRPPGDRPRDGRPPHGRPEHGRPEQGRTEPSHAEHGRPPHGPPPGDRAASRAEAPRPADLRPPQGQRQGPPRDHPRAGAPRDQGRPPGGPPPQPRPQAGAQGPRRDGGPRGGPGRPPGGRGPAQGPAPAGSDGGRRPPDRTPRRDPPSPDIIKVVRPPAGGPPGPRDQPPRHGADGGRGGGHGPRHGGGRGGGQGGGHGGGGHGGGGGRRG